MLQTIRRCMSGRRCDRMARSRVPVYSAMLVPMVGLLAINYVGPEAHTPALAPCIVPEYAEEIVLRMTWLVCATALLVGMIGCVAFSHAIICRNVPKLELASWLRRTWTVAAVLFVITLGISILDERVGFRTSWLLIRGVSSRMPFLSIFHALNAIGAVPTVFVVSAVAATVRAVEPTGELSPANLRTAIGDLKAVMYAIVVVLIIATVEIFMVHAWASAYFEPSSRVIPRVVSVVLAGVLGMLYTIFIAAVFLPAIAIQRHASMQLASQELPSESLYPKRREWLVQHDLWASPWNTFARALAVLGPMATGVVVPLLTAAIESLSE